MKEVIIALIENEPIIWENKLETLRQINTETESLI